MSVLTTHMVNLAVSFGCLPLLQAARIHTSEYDAEE